MENNSQRKRIVLGVMLIAVIVITIAGTFAYFVSNTQSTPSKLTVTTGTLALTFSDNTSVVALNNLQFGQSTSKRFTIENTGTLDVTTNMLWNNLINTYTEGSLTYKFEYSTNETGPWTAVPNANGNIPQSESASDKTLAPDITIPALQTYYYQLTITLNHLADIDQTADKDAILSSNFKLGDKILTPSEATLAKLKITTVKPGNPSFGTVPTGDEGVYAMADDYGTSYYYRGAATKNYVKFGKWATGTTLADGTDASGKDMYWRIVRINGDGSIRMIYDGTQAYNNANNGSGSGGADRFIATGQQWNANYNDAKYVGWMFGGNDGSASTSKSDAQTNTTDSDIKEVVDSWYETNLKTTYGQYIADAVYCNDRSTPPNGTTWYPEQAANDKLGFGRNVTPYGGWSRFLKTDANWNTTNPTPKFTCEQANDMFTVDAQTIQGKTTNGSLKNPVGLITADEAVAAGAVPNTASHYHYLYKNNYSYYWSLSPMYMSTDGYARVFVVGTSGGLLRYSASNSDAVAPVISLKAEYVSQLTGEGTTGSPFQISGVA